MKVASSADWRRSIPFESPVLVAEIVPGEATRCFACGPTSDVRERSELWAYKHRHPIHHDGYVRFYCQEHVPAAPRVDAAPAVAGRAPRAPRSTAPGERALPRRSAATDPPVRAMCPTCYVEVSATGLCGMCGVKVA